MGSVTEPCRLLPGRVSGRFVELKTNTFPNIVAETQRFWALSVSLTVFYRVRESGVVYPGDGLLHSPV